MDNARYGATFPWMCATCTAEAQRAEVGEDIADNRDDRGVDLAVSTTDIGTPALESTRLDAAMQ